MEGSSTLEAQHSQTLPLYILDLMTFHQEHLHPTSMFSTICLSVSFPFNVLSTTISLSPKDTDFNLLKSGCSFLNTPGSKGFGGENDDLLPAHFPFPVMSLSSSLKCPSPLKCKPSDSATSILQSYLPTICQFLHSLKILHLAYHLALCLFQLGSVSH